MRIPAISVLLMAVALSGTKALPQGSAAPEAGGPASLQAQRGSALEDGLESAPAGPPQHPALLREFPARPPWHVAGVDYAAGVPAGMNLRDPLTISIPGVLIDGERRLIRIDADDVSLDGFDFALHGGFALYITGANASISNGNFALGSSSASYLILDQSQAGGLTITNCTMDGAALGNLTSFIGYSAPGLLSLMHNHFRNFPQHVLELAQRPGTRFAVTYKYNLIENGALQKGAHLNYLQFNSGDADSVMVEFNTSFQTRQVSGGEGYQFYDNASEGRIKTVTVSHNTMIAAGSPTRVAMSYLLHGSHAQLEAATACCNYFDFSSAYGVFYPGTFKGWNVFQNVNMKTGGVIGVHN